jgi:hypothetical protein
VKQIEVSGGRGFELRRANSRDLLLVRDASGVGLARTVSVVSDFEYTWLRFFGDDPHPAEVLVLRGQNLEVAGQKIVESSERVDYSYLSRDARQETYVRN